MAEMASIAVYILCALTSIVCALMLLRGYLRSGTRLLLWSALCFTGLALNNLLLFTDKLILPEREFFVTGRTIIASVSLSLLLYGLIWDAE